MQFDEARKIFSDRSAQIDFVTPEQAPNHSVGDSTGDGA